MQMFTIKAPIITAADVNFDFFFLLLFSREASLDIHVISLLGRQFT